eukprot:TRINITY_DN13962_c0_g1_i1.p1 TRINITY_DN13962_c0_g1~~TRINITY_DN13962_c0_g1_i1.p1  ORF type:complete len:247 (-),score=39.28 TRINITY_DN13962_c0_g1_i1:183-845(-)
MGTLFLTLTVGLNVAIEDEFNPVMVPLAVGSILMVMIFMGGHISGGHFNPAITIGVYLRGGNKISWSRALLYILSQIVASIVAAAISYGISGFTFSPEPGSKYSIPPTLAVEFLFSFALVLVVLMVSTTRALDGNQFYGLAIGFTVLSGGFTTAGISGAAFNPALATGTMLIDLLSPPPYRIQYLWVYWLGPVLGGIFASMVFRFIHLDEYQTESEPEGF